MCVKCGLLALTQMCSCPLFGRLIDNMLLLTSPCSNQVPLQISNVEYWYAVDMFLHHDPDLVVYQIQARTVRWPQI